MDTLSDPSSPMLTPVRQNLTAEVPYATPASLVTVNISPLVLSPSFLKELLSFHRS
jgi:hypothetical protein